MILRKKILYIAGIVVGIVIFIWMIRQIIAKYHFQKLNRNIEICVELGQIKKICEKYQYPLENCLEKIHVVGVTSLVVSEETFDSLQNDGKIIYFSRGDFEKLRLLNLISLNAVVSPETVIIRKRHLAKKFMKILEEKTKYDIKAERTSGYTILGIDGKDLLKKIGWGFDDEKLSLADRYGFKVVLRLHRDRISWIPSQLPENLSCVIFDEEFDEQILQKLKSRNVKVPIFEFFADRSILDSLRKAPYSAVRAHRIESGSMGKPMELLLDRWQKAVRERSCRLLYFDFTDSLDVESNLDYLGRLCDALKKEKYILAAVDTEKLSLNKLISISPGISDIISLFIAVFIPVFSLGYMWRYIKKLENPITSRMFLGFYILSTINICAGVFINTLLSNYQFYVKLYEFHYVKFAFLLPFIFLIPMLYSKQQLKEMWHKSIQTKDVVVCMIILLTAVTVIMRSGNYPLLPVSGLELKLRSLLEDIFVFKPRFKEFLFGHPLLILGLWSKSKFLLILGIVGQVSIINTFIHVHTPIDVSFIRTIYGLLLGSVLGLMLIVSYRRLFRMSVMV